ncbi:hypothetical protein [Brevundimonas mediterranea]|jgi:hypothetical protein
MLSLLILALSNGAVIVHPAPPVDQPMVRVVPVVDQAMIRCSDPLVQTQTASPSSAGAVAPLLDRSRDDGQVRRYLLLDRRDQNNCPAPISYDVPNQPRALGREFGPYRTVEPNRSERPARPGL